MSSRGKAPRPAGTDGTDHEYRMLIEAKYRQLARQRRRLELVTMYLSAIVGVHSLWRSGSYLFGGSTGATEALAFVAWAVFRTALYLYATGFGKPQRENLQVLKSYSTLHILYFLQALRDTFIQGLLLRDKTAAGVQASLDGFWNISSPSTGVNMLLLFLDLAELALLAASFVHLRAYLSLKLASKAKNT